jgi:glycosyltransferase involved in cell wall biosynthesis
VPPGVVVHNDLGSNAAELVALARRCDLFALPTRADCFSIASLEAMAAGLPVITSDVGGIADIVREGETGTLLAPDDYDGLCDRLDTLLDSPTLRQAMGRKGREVVCAHFEVRALVRRGLRLMAGLASPLP